MVKKDTGSKSPPGKKLYLAVEKREILGKKVRKLRREGVLPANIYGAAFASQTISLPSIDFKKIYKKARETSIVHLKIDKQSSDIPVLIQNIQYHPTRDAILHVDFRKVNLKKKIQTSVPVTFTGESEPVSKNEGVLQTLLDSLIVEALPDRIPNEIAIDISILKKVGDEVKIADLKTTTDYSMVDEPSRAVVRVIEHKEEEVAPQIEEEAPEEEEKIKTEEEAPVEGEEKQAKVEDKGEEKHKTKEEVSAKENSKAEQKKE